MKTLYLSDLDGTLLRSDQKTSKYTDSVINRLVEHGTVFSYATARSFSPARRATEGLRLTSPVIGHNGANITDPSGTVLWSAAFTEAEKREIFSAFRRAGLTPVVYAAIGGRERFSYLKEECGRAQWEFLLTRIGDGREREVISRAEALEGDAFYFTCIDDEGKLSPVLRELEGKYCCHFPKDIYSGEQWLEVMPKTAGKAHAAEALKEMLGCDRIVCFGDHLNDLPLFAIADERYAVENAEEALKKIATDIIGGNDEDGVARWLEEHA